MCPKARSSRSVVVAPANYCLRFRFQLTVPTTDYEKIFLACASVDLVALMDQTTLAASLTIVGNSLHAGQQLSWLANGYFMYVVLSQ